MKFRIWEIIVLISLLVGAIIFASLNSLWNGFLYFTISTIILFIGFFINNRIYYIRCLKGEYDENIDTYFAELYNNNMITKEQFNNRDQRVVNGYYKDFQKTKLINIFIIVGLILLAISASLVVFGIW